MAAIEQAPFTESVEYFLWSARHKASAREISPEGLFISGDLQNEGTLLTIRLALPGGKAFTVLGRVSAVVLGGATRHRGMQIAFVDIAPSDRSRIAQYVAERCRNAA